MVVPAVVMVVVVVMMPVGQCANNGSQQQDSKKCYTGHAVNKKNKKFNLGFSRFHIRPYSESPVKLR